MGHYILWILIFVAFINNLHCSQCFQTNFGRIFIIIHFHFSCIFVIFKIFGFFFFFNSSSFAIIMSIFGSRSFLSFMNNFFMHSHVSLISKIVGTILTGVWFNPSMTIHVRSQFVFLRKSFWANLAFIWL